MLLGKLYISLYFHITMIIGVIGLLKFVYLNYLSQLVAVTQISVFIM